MKKIYILALLITVFALNMQAQKTYEEFIIDALDYTEAKDYLAAEQAYKAALRKEPANPGNVMLLLNLGTVQRYLGEYDEALISYNIVIEKHPTLPFLLQSRAALYGEMGKYVEAVKDYNTILLHDPKNLQITYDRAIVYMAMGNLETADADFKTILENEPENKLAITGIALVMKRKGEWKEAEELYSDLIYKNKTNGELYFQRAECNLNLKKLGRMTEDITKALEYGYDDYSIYILRGQLRLAQYDKFAAKTDFLKAQEEGANEELIKEFLLLCK